MDIERLAIALSWFAMVWFVSAALFVIGAQVFLPRAWKAIRAQPPHGPDWARAVWYGRSELYGRLMGLSLLLGLVAGVAYLFLG